MSRIGKNPITIPANTTVSADGNLVTVRGPLGELRRQFRPTIAIDVGEKEITVKPKKKDKQSQALWGTYASHLKNMIAGVNKEYEKTLIIEGVGFRASVSGDTLTLLVGYSHPVEVAIPDGLKIAVQKNVITVSGINKELVGSFTADVRSQKKPEPYKGKGIRYENEVIRRKQGKKVA